MVGLAQAIHMKGEAMRIDTVGLMTPGDMGQALALQIKARGNDAVQAVDRLVEIFRNGFGEQ
jgi:phosphotransferase system HPr-like phosphotransfer protein